MELTTAQKLSFIEDGFLHLPGAVSQELVTAAWRAINTNLGTEGIDDREKMVTFSSQSWTPSLRDGPAITDLFNESTLKPVLTVALGGEPGESVFGEVGSGQIALRFPLDDEEVKRVEMQPEATRWGGRMDGLHTPTNGVPKGVLGTFTCLVPSGGRVERAGGRRRLSLEIWTY